MARNGHKSSFAGLILSGARPVYIDPYYDEELEIALTPVVADLAAALLQRGLDAIDRLLHRHRVHGPFVTHPGPSGTLIRAGRAT